MGWWERYDGTVIGDELADVVGDALDAMVKKLVKKFPRITRDQIRHTIAFCGNYTRHFDESTEQTKEDKVLLVLSAGEMDTWLEEHSIASDESKRIAPGTDLMNVKSPFEEVGV